MKFKGLEDDSKIKEIGSVFRRHGGADWSINVKLTPHQQKQYFGFSQVPILARRRVLNATTAFPQAGFTRSVTITSTRSWEVEQIKACPIPAVNRARDAKQWCFVFDFNGVRYFLPQIELARVLFLHTAYLARLSLIHQGLSQEFDIQTSELNKVWINILPTSSLPLKARSDDALRQRLAWTLLDEDARHSFESIATYQLNNGYDSDKYRLWDFQFDPPALAGTGLVLRGHFDSDLNAFFVYEIDAISKLPSSCPAHVDIVDPRYSTGQPEQGRSGQARPHTGAELTIDDDEEPNTDLTEVQIDAPSFKFELARPLSTTRISAGKSRAGSHEKEEEQTEPPENNCLEVSTDESSIHGVLPPADYNSVAGEKNDNTNVYTDKFKAFDAMVQQLVNTPDCVHMHHEIRKLPAIYGYSKHLLGDGSPRYLAWHVIKKGHSIYSLVEVDTTDNRSSLSTLLIKQNSGSFSWKKYIGELEIHLIRHSLVWPTTFLKQTLENNYKRISHPKSPPENKGLLHRESIQKWAERVKLEVLSD